ncbi:MAG: metal ABC transporter ATP-binding protein [Enterococcus sp.]
MLVFSDISATYDGNQVVVDQLNFQVKQPGIIGIVGPNGAGKSTFIKAALRLIPSTGKMSFQAQPLKKFQRKIAYVEQKSVIDHSFPITVKECVSLGLYPNLKWFQKISQDAWSKVEAALAKVQMLDFKERQIGELSGGQFQRVLIARTLVQEAQLIFLDEPFVGIDVQSEQIIMEQLQALKAQGKIIFIVHHDLSKVMEYFDEVLLLNKKMIAFGPTETTFTEEHIIQAFGGSVFVRGANS